MESPEVFNGRKAARRFAKDQVESGKGIGYAIGYLKNGYDILVRAYRKDNGMIICAEVIGLTSNIPAHIYNRDQMRIAEREASGK